LGKEKDLWEQYECRETESDAEEVLPRGAVAVFQIYRKKKKIIWSDTAIIGKLCRYSTCKSLKEERDRFAELIPNFNIKEERKGVHPARVKDAYFLELRRG